MRKILAILTMLMCFALVKAQSITDYENHVKISYGDGSVFTINKDLYNVDMDEDSTYVSIVSAQARGKRDHKAYLVLDPTDFGYASATLLHSYLSALMYRQYYETYTYMSNLMDTVKYWYISATDTTLQFKVNYTNTTDTLRARTIIPQ